MREAQTQAMVVAKNAKPPKSSTGETYYADGNPVDQDPGREIILERQKLLTLQSEFEAYRRSAEQERAYQWGKLILQNRAARINELQAVISMCAGIPSLEQRCSDARESLARFVLDNAPPTLTVPPMEGSLGGSHLVAVGGGCQWSSTLSDSAMSPLPVTPTRHQTFQGFSHMPYQHLPPPPPQPVWPTQPPMPPPHEQGFNGWLDAMGNPPLPPGNPPLPPGVPPKPPG